MGNFKPHWNSLASIFLLLLILALSLVVEADLENMEEPMQPKRGNALLSRYGRALLSRYGKRSVEMRPPPYVPDNQILMEDINNGKFKLHKGVSCDDQ
jgi:hypothetical protein